MPVPAWLKNLIGDRQTRPQRKRVRIHRREEEPASSGDMRGTYGFGRRAHRPDPRGHYQFENDANYWAHRSY